MVLHVWWRHRLKHSLPYKKRHTHSDQISAHLLDSFLSSTRGNQSNRSPYFYHSFQIECFCLKLQCEPLEHRCFSFSSCAWHRGFPFEKLVFLREKTPSLPTPTTTLSHRFVSPQAMNRLGRIKTRFWSRMIMRWLTGLTSRSFGWSAAASTRA